ncbi:MAG TPA: excinuclease ABC subunit UvrC [Candidatus Nanopelagicales bacterium]
MADPATYRPAAGSIPDQPGVYRFRDAMGRVVYVGKAKSLRSRLGSYFQDLSALHPRIQSMVTTAAAVDWVTVDTEVEALTLEYSWIKAYDPRFNVKYRDDKSYPYLAVTLGEEYPRVTVMRGAKKAGVRYFGPYAHAWAIRETVDQLMRVFPTRTCSSGVFKRHAQMGRPCLLGYIGKCSAPCVGRVSAAEHRAIALDFCAFMSGQTTAFTRRIEREMKAAAAELDFERAARLRDDLKALERALEKSAVVFGDGTDADVIAVADEQLESAVQVFHVRGGRIRGQRGFVVDKVEDLSPGELVGQLLVRLYGGETGDGVPREVLVPTLPPDAAAVGDWLATLRGSRVDLRVPQRGDKHDLMQTVQRNAVQSLALHKTKRASDLTARSRALEELQEALDLPEAPLRIECIDVSHLQGTDVVASLVVFEDGLPRKSEYRRFALRGAAGSDGASNDDVRSIAEVVTRRFTRLLEEKAPTADDPVPGIDPTTGRPRKFSYPPQLFVVDGGRPQVEAAAGAMSELGIVDVALVGLAKRLEEVWLPGEADPVVLPRTSEGLYLLQRLRDEAHRFAITYQRTKRATRLVDSLLDDVPGLGEARKKALLRTFGSLTRLRAATVAEIASVPGMGPVTAEAVVAALQAQQPALAINTSTGEIIEATTADPAGPVPIEGSMP